MSPSATMCLTRQRQPDPLCPTITTTPLDNVSSPEHNIDIQVETRYLDNQSNPEGEQFAFAYTITITNQGSHTAKLISRRWRITDADDSVQTVEGEGVIGEQPVLAPGESFTYTSGAMIGTAFGHMQGSYQMLAEDGQMFDAEIPAFTLACPGALH